MIQEPEWDEKKSVFVHEVQCGFLGGVNRVEVLLPDNLDRTHSHKVLYVLPVESGTGEQYGDGLQTVRTADVHNRHNLICVQPTFDTIPWFGCHATNPRIRHEAYIREILVPLIEAHYPVIPERDGRLLFGFSKSGWGAFTLILRNHDFFGYACAWDAPLMLDAWVPAWGMAEHFGTVKQYRPYRPVKLFEEKGVYFRDHTQLVLLGEQSFGTHPEDQFAGISQTESAHNMLTRLGICHIYDNTLDYPHHWDGGWVAPAIEILMNVVKA